MMNQTAVAGRKKKKTSHWKRVWNRKQSWRERVVRKKEKKPDSLGRKSSPLK